jgi:hypothetical protein
MTRYTVAWRQSVRDDLARIWIMARDRQAVADAADKIDRELSVDPDQKGREFNDVRLLVAVPLEVTYSVSADDRIVIVLQVWYRGT